jgi:hypothetical protein
MNSHIKSLALMLALLGSLVGLAACAKYPVVKAGTSAPAAAATPVPAR